jgi:hypothetical protein
LPPSHTFSKDKNSIFNFNYQQVKTLDMILVAVVGGLEVFLMICIWTLIISIVVFVISAIRNLIKGQKEIIANQKLEIELLQKVLGQKNNQ